MKSILLTPMILLFVVLLFPAANSSAQIITSDTAAKQNNYSQTFVLRGTVHYNMGQPIEAAEVGIKNSRRKTATDQNGNFRLLCAVTDSVLQIIVLNECIEEFSITDRKEMDLVLKCNPPVIIDYIIVPKDRAFPITDFRQIDSLKESISGDVSFRFRLNPYATGKYKFYLIVADEVIKRKNFPVHTNEKEKIIRLKNVQKGIYKMKIINKKSKAFFFREFRIY